ncbi:DUF1254 domain-containing protein [Aliivibrio finisterrensis]|uniref:DUF1254 domain-containing protein n=1 Tax=Aliivibrio finisterrensis TaxID=511998 RepID=UPI00102172C5|nr:DUF1254 domain-containing protein [Aliivibrio finisterrensis]RYU67712.1 DUF1254 domain-containing protein [Aliivibrio finisterrensis]RYU74004.1 DUF1254 domain-containing protein [Aliivibrio finisterrensis]
MFKKQITAAIVASVLISSLSINAQELNTSSLTPSAQIQQNQASTWLEQETYLLATNAYLWGSTLVRMEQVARQYTDMSQPQNDTSYRAPLNHFGHARRLPTDQDTDMPTANRDTLYSSAIVDVSKEPMILSTPEVDNRYFVIDIHRFNVNDQTPIKKNKDGSFDLILSHDKPSNSTQLANWLPTSEGNFYAITRLYVPSQEILDMKWTVPPINPIK